MTRSIRAALAVSLIALAAPAAALATHGRPMPGGFPVTVPTSGAVSGYTGGTLTLALNAGGSVSGAVTNPTRFVCPRVGAPVGRGRYVPPPPCNATLLVAGEGLVTADLTHTQTGVSFRALVLVPPTGAPSQLG